MNIYLFKLESGLTDEYHDGGGVAVVASDVEDAIRYLPEACQREASNSWVEGRVTTFELNPMVTYKPYVKVFPDRGCC